MLIEAATRLRASSGSASVLFDRRLLADESVPRYKGREKLIEMRIDDFLALARPLPQPVPSKEKNIIEVVDSGRKLDSLPFLLVDNSKGGAKVDGHEGRHRALFFKSRGYATMPVTIKMSGLRWSSQENPKDFDYIEDWPEWMVGETGGRIPFPVRRENAMAPYVPKLQDPVDKVSALHASQLIFPTNSPDGTFIGVYSGYVCQWTADNNAVYEIKTPHGIRGTAKATVTVTGGQCTFDY